MEAGGQLHPQEKEFRALVEYDAGLSFWEKIKKTFLPL
jgi:hypothetical protein